MAEMRADATARPALGEWLAPLVAALVTAVALMNGSLLLGDPDIQWHLAAGRWIAQNLTIPDRDVFSHSMPGAPWHAHEWLAELLFWWAYRIAGWAGVVAVSAAAAGLAFGLLASRLLRSLEPRHAMLLCAAAFAVVSQHMIARPHVLAWPLLVLWAAMLCRAAERRSAPPLAGAATLALWANLHGGYVFGLALAGFFALEALWSAAAEERLRLLRGWAAFLAASLLASLIAPQEPAAGIRFAFGFLDGGGFIAPIAEWAPADFGTVSGLEVVLLGMLVLALSGRFQLPAFRILLLVGLVHLSLAHVRHGELLGLVGPLAVAPALGKWLAPSLAQRKDASHAARGAAGGLVALAILLWAGLAKPEPPASVAPAAALAAAREAGVADDAVLNAFDFGGFLIGQGVPVFIDGRADFYGEEFISDYLDAVRSAKPGALEALLERYAIGWTMLQAGTPAALLLDRLPGWVRIHADETAVVHRRLAPSGSVP
jgi:hypothetical protein